MRETPFYTPITRSEDPVTTIIDHSMKRQRFFQRRCTGNNTQQWRQLTFLLIFGIKFTCYKSTQTGVTDKITIRLKGANEESDQFGQIVEVAAPAAGELDLFKAKNGDKTNHELRIVEVEFKAHLNNR